MKKIINGRRYDTESARELGHASFGNWGDFHYWCETLYRKSTGEFFLHGEGGPATKYAEAVGQNEWKSGQRLMPMDLEEARQWAEEHLTGDEYERIFGIPEGDETKKTVNFSLTIATIEKIARMAAENGCTKSEIIERAFME